jgi:hypothetical protein
MAYYLPGQKAWFRKRQISLAIRVIGVSALVVMLATVIIVRLIDSKNELRDRFELRALQDHIKYRGLQTQFEGLKEKYRKLSGDMESFKAVGGTQRVRNPGS